MADDRDSETTYEDETAPIFVRRPVSSSADLDITPMIDIVFLLLVFFLVASIPDAKTDVALPPARYGEGVSERSSIVITVAKRSGSGGALVYLGNGKIGAPLSGTASEQTQAIASWVREGVESGKTSVLVKGEGSVSAKDVQNVTSAVGMVGGVSLHLGVMESD